MSKKYHLARKKHYRTELVKGAKSFDELRDQVNERISELSAELKKFKLISVSVENHIGMEWNGADSVEVYIWGAMIAYQYREEIQ